MQRNADGVSDGAGMSGEGRGVVEEFDFGGADLVAGHFAIAGEHEGAHGFEGEDFAVEFFDFGDVAGGQDDVHGGFEDEGGDGRFVGGASGGQDHAGGEDGE